MSTVVVCKNEYISAPASGKYSFLIILNVNVKLIHSRFSGRRFHSLTSPENDRRGINNSTINKTIFSCKYEKYKNNTSVLMWIDKLRYGSPLSNERLLCFMP